MSQTIICKSCRHNCNHLKDKKKMPILANKPHAICWCNAENGRVINKKYKKCKFYEPRS